MTNRRDFLKTIGVASAGLLLPRTSLGVEAKTDRPNIVLIMTDDQGWGQTGYYNHPVLKTPNIDKMAAGGLRFDRFYAGAPVCSPTRASVLTGRFCQRTGVPSHGHALRLQEKTLPKALKAAGYATGHFGKWHLNGLRGPGAPILKEDTHNPGVFGFDEWLSVSNFFDMNPIMSRKGVFEEFKGDSSAIIVSEALKFISASVKKSKPFLAVIWDGSPHSPWVASEEDRKAFGKLDQQSQQHYGELAAFDRSVGVLRKGLRDLGAADNTLVWYCSDNGGLSGIKPETVGGLRGNKGSVFEGGIRVPGVIEWPARVKPRITSHPATTMDIFPTIADILGLGDSVLLRPRDGISLTSLLESEIGARKEPIGFRFGVRAALVDNDYKLVTSSRNRGQFALYNLKTDPKESKDISADRPEVFKRMKAALAKWSDTVDASIAGKDYPEGKVNPGEPTPQFWWHTERYKPYLEDWKKRPEYSGRLNRKPRKKPKKKR